MDKFIVPLYDMDGKEENFELLDIIKFEGLIYAVFYPTKVGETEVLIYRVDESDDSEKSIYSFVEDKRIREEVYKLFKEKYDDEFKFND